MRTGGSRIPTRAPGANAEDAREVAVDIAHDAFWNSSYFGGSTKISEAHDCGEFFGVVELPLARGSYVYCENSPTLAIQLGLDEPFFAMSISCKWAIACNSSSFSHLAM